MFDLKMFKSKSECLKDQNVPYWYTLWLSDQGTLAMAGIIGSAGMDSYVKKAGLIAKRMPTKVKSVTESYCF